ncbi:MAG: malto-oligosyltrehalose trehalohydrolase [Myxococcales bacterium]|nr:malto-oligosyltrehalose trehalohydrolase [Myxococcales bacterium]
MSKPRLGSTRLADGRVRIVIWAPHAKAVRAEIYGPSRTFVIDLVETTTGYFGVETAEVGLGSTYRISVDGGPWLPDPASRSLPDGVHGATEVVESIYSWMDAGWTGIKQHELVFYELHIGTFTPEGTFDAAIAHLDALLRLGITAVELLPLAEVPGRPQTRNWGYDGVQMYAVRRDYGGINGLHRFVDACHSRGLAVILDVVYNHLGPEGNYLSNFGPYFTDRYHVPWGQALNFDGPYSDDVRHYFIMHAIECLEEHHLDGLRLDSAPNIFDRSPNPFLAELSQQVARTAKHLGRSLYLIAEADDNSARWVRPVRDGGMGLHAFWADDLHHALHAWFTEEQQGFYQDFGKVQDVARAFIQGAVLDGGYSEFRKRRWGTNVQELSPDCFVSFLQNHDRVGNRGDGVRFGGLVDPPAHRVALALSLLTPTLPLLFMGQEYGETNPFYFFSSFDDHRAVQGLRQGRRDVFLDFGGKLTAPDPQLPSARELSRLQHKDTPEASSIRSLHEDALRLRKILKTHGSPVLSEISEEDGFFTCWWPSGHILQVFLRADHTRSIDGSPRGGAIFDTHRYLVNSISKNEQDLSQIGGPRLMVYGPNKEGNGEKDE